MRSDVRVTGRRVSISGVPADDGYGSVMSVMERVWSVLPGPWLTARPVGAIRIVDPSPLNWLYITYNTVEELVRVTPGGKIRPAAMRRYRWVDERTLEVVVRKGETYQDGEPMTASSVKQSFDEQRRWVAPHPPFVPTSTSTTARPDLRGVERPHRPLPPARGRRAGARQAASDAHHEQPVLARSRVRLRPPAQRRRPLVSD